MIELGQEARDKVTGLTGIITGRSQWLTGCDTYLLTPKAGEDGLKENVWFDEGRIEVIGPGIAIVEVKADRPGGPQPRDLPRGSSNHKR